MTILCLLAAIACLPLLVTDAVFLVEVLFGLRAGEHGSPARPAGPIALIVPAHNEEGVVRASVERMIAESPPGTRVLVVAHNCSDRTAEQARAGGAEVHVLDEPDRRGKGYALAGGQAVLRAAPPATVIVVDADCTPAPGALARLAATAEKSGRAVQASYLFAPRRDAGPIVQISNFAMLVKNLVRQRGSRRIGAPALLTGSGMAFPWPLFAMLDLATGNIVEDLALGVELVRQGRPPLFESRATIWSHPSSEGGTATQRARWEGGFLATARGFGLPLLARGLVRFDGRMIWMGLHLLTAPLTLLLMLNGAAMLLWLGLWAIGVAPAAAPIAAFLLGASVVAAVLAAWALAGRAMLSAGTLARLPLYMAWKLALYARIVRGRETPGWIRTERVD
ncbi:glycosyltransferase family 2 protein [Sphingomonas sp. BIUV-7]|uniref:Glycosyltransferase family 2 protein n=1 Tax=Sphingomonas natans TaxID=3063330 RepID=A0ABT8YC74_9SPHN|nr:glycosyltransferase family 2 protein [Sphingomonas sp. BIUV-7]MDO6415924.1 glycosyltransferase family 2 protein [Sphingomonas sp. BIUV-7]